MSDKKLIQLSNIQNEMLDEIQEEIKNKGGNVSISQLIRDSIQIFLDYYKKDAISKYSSHYQLKRSQNE